VLDWSHRQRHPGCRGKRVRVIAKNRGPGEFFDELLVPKLHQSQFTQPRLDVETFPLKPLGGIAE
jgi:hypothetical protein